jgi:hypothetical protein
MALALLRFVGPLPVLMRHQSFENDAVAIVISTRRAMQAPTSFFLPDLLEWDDGAAAEAAVKCARRLFLARKVMRLSYTYM